MHTKDGLRRDLEKMELRPTETVLIHSSMKAIGDVEGRADGVLDALLEFFAPGLLVFPTLTWEIANDDPPVFDARRSKCLVGVLPELFRKRPGVVRSLHPTHSVAAAGGDAAWLVSEDHLNHTPCGKTSSWHKLLERDAKILMVGCDLTRCTFLHGVEEWCDVPGRLEKRVRFTVIDVQGDLHVVDSSPHKGTPSEQFWKAEGALRAAGALADGRLGDAKVMALSARRTYETVRSMLLDDPELFSEEG